VTWTSTVDSAHPSASAMALFVWPSTSNAKTLDWPGVMLHLATAAATRGAGPRGPRCRTARKCGGAPGARIRVTRNVSSRPARPARRREGTTSETLPISDRPGPLASATRPSAQITQAGDGISSSAAARPAASAGSSAEWPRTARGGGSPGLPAARGLECPILAWFIATENRAVEPCAPRMQPRARAGNKGIPPGFLAKRVPGLFRVPASGRRAGRTASRRREERHGWPPQDPRRDRRDENRPRTTAARAGPATGRSGGARGDPEVRPIPFSQSFGGLWPARPVRRCEPMRIEGKLRRRRSVRARGTP
jgi:hypothetical protein